MAEAPLRRYFKLPEDVKTVDFVHQIDRDASAERIAKTLDDYQVTPSIARNLTTALDHMRRGLADRRSVFSWIHGSFGCGKSHFMNILSLLVADEKAVYNVHPELQAQRKKFHPAVIGKKLFRLHIQCISRGATTLEEIVFGAAVEELERLHPGAPPPALFESQKLFASAQRLLDDLGDAKFFGAFPSNQGAADDDTWGDLGGDRWNRARFEAALSAPQSNEARDLAGELAKTPWLEGIAASSAFVRLGPGLQILADHLGRLGYEGVVLFLDELVLWLSTFQDPKKLALEAPKVSTLVEHGDYPRTLPYLTFAARQRDLSEMVGKLAVGSDEVIFRDQLSFWKDRFETISLEDKDLPRIIEKRVLRTAGPQADAEINAAFETYKRTFAQDFRVLTGNQGDADDFRRVYPFSPALVEVMVALSATLQRDRTALRELTNLLVNYLPDFELGKVVPVGDLFDVVAHGQTSDLPAIQRLYEQARQIYETELLPHIRKKNETDTPKRCQLLREEFDARLGCSGCAEAKCRTQTRIAKTVLLQGLVPNTPALKDLTASGLVHLNSGTLKSRIPNQEPAQATAMVKEWAAITTAVHVKGDVNPEVRGVLDRVNVRRILDFCRDLDNEQRRRMRVRDILFEKMGVTQKDQGGIRSFDWRGRKWRIGFVYDNVRLANKNVFRPSESEDLRVVIDYPFDDAGYGPREDEEEITQLIDSLSGKDAERGLATVVWLPAFIDEDTRRALADLVTIEGLIDLRDQDLANRIPFVSMDELSRVRSTLEQQRELKKKLVEEVLESAYGVNHKLDTHLSPGLAPDQRAYLLRRETKISVPIEPTFDRALEGVLKQALEARAPRHPAFGKAPTKARLEAVLDLLDRLVETPERKARFDKAQIEDLRAIAAAEHLGIARIIDDEATLAGGILDQATKNLAHHKGSLSVGAVRAALDPDGLMELSPEVQDFLVLAYAKAAPKPLRLFSHGDAVQGLIGKLSDDLALVPVELPSQTTWQAALRAAGLLGIVLQGSALTPPRVDELTQKARKAGAEREAAGVGAALKLLAEWQSEAGINDPVEATLRGSALSALRDLCRAVREAGDSASAVVDALARFSWDEKRTTAITHMAGPKAIERLVEALRSESLRTPIRGGRGLESDPEPARRDEATLVMGRVRQALVSDENVIALRDVLEREATRITQILVNSRPPARPNPENTSLGEGGVAKGGIVEGKPAGMLGGEVDHRPLAHEQEETKGPTPPVFIDKKVSPLNTAGLPSREERTLQSAEDVRSLAEHLMQRIEAGEPLRVTIETLGGDKR